MERHSKCPSWTELVAGRMAYDNRVAGRGNRIDCRARSSQAITRCSCTSRDFNSSCWLSVLTSLLHPFDAAFCGGHANACSFSERQSAWTVCSFIWCVDVLQVRGSGASVRCDRGPPQVSQYVCLSVCVCLCVCLYVCFGQSVSVCLPIRLCLLQSTSTSGDLVAVNVWCQTDNDMLVMH